MAIFWNHIKGTGNATDNTDGLWTWIKWSQSTTAIAGEGPHSMDYSSEILVFNSNGNPTNATSLGKILTTNINATTQGDWTTHGEWINYGSWKWMNNTNYVFRLTPTSTSCEINTSHYPVEWTVNKLSFKNVNTFLTIDPRLFDSKLNISNQGKITNQGDIEITGTITAKGKCEALYFNATSDKRAKENIVPATFSGLDLINKLSLYTFNYKDTAGTVPGILAQDLLEVQPEGLDLVDNIAATGENGDYMSIKEGKLIFVLMKAIKEQQQQIDELKTEIEKLKQ